MFNLVRPKYAIWFSRSCSALLGEIDFFSKLTYDWWTFMEGTYLYLRLVCLFLLINIQKPHSWKKLQFHPWANQSAIFWIITFKCVWIEMRFNWYTGRYNNQMKCVHISAHICLNTYQMHTLHRYHARKFLLKQICIVLYNYTLSYFISYVLYIHLLIDKPK